MNRKVQMERYRLACIDRPPLCKSKDDDASCQDVLHENAPSGGSGPVGDPVANLDKGEDCNSDTSSSNNISTWSS